MGAGELERDTCRDSVLPALAAAGWSNAQVRPEYPVAEQRVMSAGGTERDLGAGRVDYVLEVVPGLPVAVVEAKRKYRSASDGVQQAIRYAQQLDVPIAYATNGREIVARDMVAGTERVVDSFETPAEIWGRYAAARDLDEEGRNLLHQAFNRRKTNAAGDLVEPRWYQSVAIHRALTAIARGQNRVLLLMATGSGKTFTAMQLVHKLREHARVVKPQSNYRVLYLADRDVLVSSPMEKDFETAFGKDPLHRVSGPANLSREIYFATYQALTGASDEKALFDSYPADFFDLVIVDECHRGSADENSSWRSILDHFASAVQIGLTATPKQTDTIDTYSYFGDPVFSYSLRAGIQDGYLAPYRVRRVVLSPDADGWQPAPGQRDRYGREIPAGIYATPDFDRVLRLLPRTDLAAKVLTRLLGPDRTARMVIFCVNQQHADDMRRAMANANPERVQADPEWVVRIVGEEGERARLLEEFTDPTRDSPVVVTTSRLLSTGVDIEDLKYVVLFRPVGSPVEFKQIVGRGTRLYPDKDKTCFEIVDFVNATHHFADPEFDGYPTRIIIDTEEGESDPDSTAIVGGPDPVEVGEPEPPFIVTDPDDAGGDQERDHEPVERYTVDEGHVFVVVEGLQVPDTSTGKLVLKELGEFVAGRVRDLAPTPRDLGERWSTAASRTETVEALRAAGVLVDSLLPDTVSDIDVFDLLLQLAFNQPVRTRAARAEHERRTSPSWKRCLRPHVKCCSPCWIATPRTESTRSPRLRSCESRRSLSWDLRGKSLNDLALARR